MKKNKGFKVGDKVFAKVKGYPAWPAIVTEARNNKYNVKFYGTGETGTVKPKDIFYYLKHKNSFVKSHKRKDYNDAIEEIEKAIEEAGTDGDDNDSTSQADSPATTTNSIDSSTKAVKRKRSASISDKGSDTQVKRRAQSRSRTPHSLDEVSGSAEERQEENGNSESDNYIDENTLNTEKEGKVKKSSEENTTNFKAETAKNSREPETDQDEEENFKKGTKADDRDTPKIRLHEVHLITIEFLQGLIQYAEHIKQKEEQYKKYPVEDRKNDKIELLVVRQPDGGIVGINLNYEEPPSLKNEFDFAQYEEAKAKRILSFKTLVEQGSCQPEDEPNMFVTGLSFSMEDAEKEIELNLIARKKDKVTWLKTEANLIELDAKIKGSLGLDKAEPKQALEHLDKMEKLHIEPLMLKKHPPVVDMVKRLCRYIGNVKEWNLSDDELDTFEFDAARVRNKAADVYLKFASVLGVEDETKFWDTFSDQVETFKEHIQDMTETHVFALTAEPHSRKAFLTTLDEAEEMKILLSKIEKTAAKTNKPQQPQDDPSSKSVDSANVGEESNAVNNSDPVS